MSFPFFSFVLFFKVYTIFLSISDNPKSTNIPFFVSGLYRKLPGFTSLW